MFSHMEVKMSVHIDSRVFCSSLLKRITGLHELATELELDLSFVHEGSVVHGEADWDLIESQNKEAKLKEE